MTDGWGREEKLSGKEIARLNRERYRDPGRDLEATRPVLDAGAGTWGDEHNPVAAEHSHGTSGDLGFGSDERPRLARQKPWWGR